MPSCGYPRLFLTLVIVFLLGVPATAQAWKVTVHVHGAGAIDETMGRGLPDCTAGPFGTSESSSSDCVFGTPDGIYNSFDIVELTQYVHTAAFNRGWRFSKWVDGNAAGQVNCDPQSDTGDYTGNACKFQVFDNLSVDLYFDDISANPVDPLTTGPAAGTRTNSTNASFSFFSSGDPDSTYQCRLERGATLVADYAGCGSPKNYTSASLGTDGTYTFYVRAIDPSGNMSAPQSRTWTVDTVAPTVGVSGGPTAGSTVNTNSANFTLAPSETVASLMCKLDRPGVPGSYSACGSTTPAYANLNADGLYTFSTYATDAAGNSGAASPTTRSWTVDRTAPDSSISSGPSGPTSSNSASFGFSATGDTSSYECRLSPTVDWTACSSGVTYSSLTPGTYTFSVRATDAVGNVESTPATRTFTVDTQPPDTAIGSGPSGSTSSSSAAFGFSATEPNVSFECKLDAGPWESCTSGKTYSSLALGGHTFRVRARDQAGNVDASEATRTWTITTSTPSGPGPGTPSGGTADITAPVAVLSYSKQRLGRVLRKGLRGSASSTEASTLRLDVLYKGKRFAKSGNRAMLNGGSLKLVAKFTAKGKRVLGKLRKARVVLRLRVTDVAGNVTVKKKTVTLRR